MQITRHPEARSFLAAAEPSLEEAESFNNLMLGIAYRLRDIAERGDEDAHSEASAPEMVTVTDDARLVAAALMTPPRKLIVHGAAERWQAGLDALVGYLVEYGPHPPGVLGPQGRARYFAEAWLGRTQAEVRSGMMMGVYELRQVMDAGNASGHARRAGPDDVDLLLDWVKSFNRAVHEDEPADPEAWAQGIRTRVEQGLYWLWVDEGRAVSVATHSRATRHGTSITAVYTPPEQRRRGYAQACVAALSQHLLDTGQTFCSLFTDLANPTSNHIYQEVGYRRLGDFAEYSFGA